MRGDASLAPIVMVALAVMVGLTIMVGLTWPLTLAIWTDGRFLDTDDAMRMLQIRDLLAGQAWFDLTQYRLLPPAGMPMHWTRLVDLPTAAFVWAFSFVLDPAHAERLARLSYSLLFAGLLLASMARLAARWPVVALSNGNADLHRVGLGAHFKAQVSAREAGVAKPDPRIFGLAAEVAAITASAMRGEKHQLEPVRDLFHAVFNRNTGHSSLLWEPPSLQEGVRGCNMDLQARFYQLFQRFAPHCRRAKALNIDLWGHRPALPGWRGLNEG